VTNPYEVLGIKENASDEEVKKAYRESVKKYHPDQYQNNPLSELASEKLREVNEAYEAINKMRPNGQGSSNSGSTNYYDSANSSGSSDYSYIRSLINSGKIAEAERLLLEIKHKSAEWYFCMGQIYKSKGWYDNAKNHYATATNMEPGNFEYRKAYSDLNGTTSNYAAQSNGRGYRQTDNCCQTCQCLICSDCCCECMGGDLISCC